MNRFCAALLGLLLASAAQAQSVSWPPPAGALAFLCVYNSSPPTLTTTNVAFAQCDATGNLRVAGTLTPSGTQDINIKQVQGAVPSLTNPLWITPATGATFPVTQSTSPWIVAGAGTAGTSGTAVLTVQGIASGTPAPISGTVSLGSQYPVGATPITASSLNANAIITPSLAGTSGKTTYITGFELTAGGATVAGCFNVALSGTISATMNYSFCTVTGVSFAATPLIITFNPAIPASATNTAITLTVPALGAGNVTTSGTLHGYQL